MNSKNDFKKQYKQDFQELRKFMNNWDPMASISLGCPEDEYDEYTARVLAILHRSKGKINQGKKELEEYLKGFDEEIRDLKTSSKGQFSTINRNAFIEKILSASCGSL